MFHTGAVTYNNLTLEATCKCSCGLAKLIVWDYVGGRVLGSALIVHVHTS